MVIVSKTFLEEINNKLNNHLCYNQWRCTSRVIEWFRSIENKKNSKFTKFGFYPLYQQNYLKNL